MIRIYLYVDLGVYNEVNIFNIVSNLDKLNNSYETI